MPNQMTSLDHGDDEELIPWQLQVRRGLKRLIKAVAEREHMPASIWARRELERAAQDAVLNGAALPKKRRK